LFGEMCRVSGSRKCSSVVLIILALPYMADASLEMSLFLVFVSRSVLVSVLRMRVGGSIFRRAIASNMELP
jgi:hypothetical protein